MEELSDAAKNMAFTDDLEKSQEERMDILYRFIKVNFLNSHCPYSKSYTFVLV